MIIRIRTHSRGILCRARLWTPYGVVFLTIPITNQYECTNKKTPPPRPTATPPQLRRRERKTMKTKRKIPSVMFTQHPDHAGRPYWHDKPFIETRDELQECFLMMRDIGAQEVMWDWEGKLVDEAVMERLLHEHLSFFRKHPLGEKVFLTFRVPNPRVELGYRLGRAFMVILSARESAESVGLNAPLFEGILPMTENAAEMLTLHRSFERFSKA